jgi:hypothetical protein
MEDRFSGFAFRASKTASVLPILHGYNKAKEKGLRAMG